jgi:hypothetical protein
VPAALPCVRATCYVTALREGGSMPGLVEASDDGMYVTKFRGSGQGVNALVAEVAAGELARRLGLLVPDLAVVEIPVELGRAEPGPGRCRSRSRSRVRSTRISQPTSSGSTRSSRTSTAPIATRTCCSGTGAPG